MSEQVKVILTVTLLAASIGIWTGVSGKPYSVALLTAHKLSGVAAVVLAAIVVVGRMRGSSVGGVAWILAATGILGVIALVGTGIVMRGEKPATALLRAGHVAGAVVFAASASGLTAVLLRV